MSAKPGGHLVADALALNGTRMVFTVPGNSVLGTLDGLREHTGVQVVVCRQEGGAAFMADAYARLTREPGVCLVSRGPGATNASIGVGVLTAQEEGTPLMFGRNTRDFEKHIFADWFGSHAMLVAATSTPGEMTKLTGRRNPYPDAKLGVIEEGAYADILVVDGNPLEDISVIGANDKWFDAQPREEGIETIRVIMKDGKIYKNTL